MEKQNIIEPEIPNSDDRSITEIVEICEFCNQEGSNEVKEAKLMSSEKSVTCLFKEIRGIDSTNPL